MLLRRRVPCPPANPNIDLLADLLATPAAETRVRPVALRSVVDQRRTVLAPYPLRTWIDRVLKRAERVLAIVVVGGLGWWLVDGYGRDWWHARSVPPPVPSVAAVPLDPALQAAIDALPQVGSTAKEHPELGASLPVVQEERWTRPTVSVDYIAPARVFVPPVQPTPKPVAVVPPPPSFDLRPMHLTIPAIQLDSNVVEVFIQNGAWQVAEYAVGYHHDTGVVARSNMVLAGHKGARGGVFRNLEQLKPGDDVFVDAAGRRFQYRVRSVGNVWPNQTDVMYPTDKPQLTLLTCTNWDTQRFVVFADFIGVLPQGAAGGASTLEP